MYFFCALNTLPRISYMNFFRPKGQWSHFKRVSDEYILYYLVEGEMYLKENDKEYILKSGDVFLLQPGLVYEGTKPAECAYYFSQFKNISILPQIDNGTSQNLLNHMLDRRKETFGSDQLNEALYDMAYCIIPKHSHIQNEDMCKRLNFLFDQVIEQSLDKVENYKILNSCKLLEIMIDISRNCTDVVLERRSNGLPPRTVKKIDELITFLNTQYRDKITGKQLEDTFEMNYDYLNRVFSKTTGITIFQYLNQVRINRAKELLATTDMKLIEIALETGFADEFYFSKLFKKNTGLSPVIYAKSILKN